MSNILHQRETEAKSIVKQKMRQIETLLKSDKAKASAYASALVSLASNKNLRNCSVESIVGVGFEVVQAGLNPNPIFGQAYVVPFRTKNGEVAQLQIGYKGWLTLGARHGWKFRPVPVYRCDEFSIEFGGFEDTISLGPNFDDRDESDGNWVHQNLRGVVVYAKDPSGEIFTEFVPFKKLEKIRLKSQNQKSGDRLDHIWLEWAEEMYKAKAIKYVITRLPITEQMMEAAVKENEPHLVGSNVTDVETVDLNQIAAKQPPADHDPDTGEVTEKVKPSRVSSHFSSMIRAGVKRSDLSAFVEWAGITDENIDDVMKNIEGLAKRFYDKDPRSELWRAMNDHYQGDVAAVESFAIQALEWPEDTVLPDGWFAGLGSEETAILQAKVRELGQPGLFDAGERPA